MYELVQISDSCYYIDSPTKIGVYVRDAENVYLVDSGNDKRAGKKAGQILSQNGWRLRGILNTHCHADHIGGNNYLQKQTGCKIFAKGMETALIRYPILEPIFLYGGCPPKELRHKFLLAQESDVTDFSDNDFPKEVKILPLSGHTFDMSGFLMPDGTAFLGDCVSSQATLEKYAVSYLYDVQAYLETLDIVENMEATAFVPAHTEVTKDISMLVTTNRNKVWEIANRLLQICQEPKNFEMILQEIFKSYQLKMSFEQYALVGGTIRSYLSWLKERQELAIDFADQMLLWRRA